MNKQDFIAHFREPLFIPEMQATHKDEAIQELLQVFVDEKFIRNPEIVLEMLRQRETLGSTGIGKGVAIPHGRTVAASDVLVGFGKSEKGIDFESIDGKPVTLFFMVISPPHDEGNIYLPILGSLVTVLNKDAKRNALQNVETFEEFLKIISGE